jgi:Mg-chelatase subunit ChlD
MQIKNPPTKKPSVDSLASSVTAASVVGSDTATLTDAAAGSAALALTLSADLHENHVLVSVHPPSKPQRTSEKDAGKRAPLDICCVIDVSGSMSTEALMPADPTTGAPAESTGLSVLDVVKHALRTIVSTLQPG